METGMTEEEEKRRGIRCAYGLGAVTCLHTDVLSLSYTSLQLHASVCRKLPSIHLLFKIYLKRKSMGQRKQVRQIHCINVLPILN